MATVNVTRSPNWGRVPDEVRASARGGWVERCARLGYGAKGVVYAIIGTLALRLALGQGGRTTDSHGAVESVAHQPFGRFLLALLAVGLVGFVVWRWVQAFLDPEHVGTRGKALVKRVAYFAGGALYAGLALTAAQRALGGAPREGTSTRGWTARLLEQPLGQVLVALVGLVVIGYAVKEFHKAFTANFRRKLDLQRLAPNRAHTAVQLCRFGLAARGGVFLLIGAFFIRAALQADPGEAKGLGEALAILARQPHGVVLLGITAAGLVAYALYLFIEARYRRIAPSV
ncbi:DUF1206 domain-containing protein [Hyalangium rubrum]|uniref:DUF1206 domain-containing protein n=1 Tax=Hyalangium rubrum TaxID=3103134 RepID=A0ABU5HDX0_9BACT|nr:DUF1206 domain-containing protein [Hyalangium sp. s54d21]MDY7231059.1 DUF1206 domain-containing protein [Hyalangium sp. s54d21]